MPSDFLYCRFASVSGTTAFPLKQLSYSELAGLKKKKRIHTYRSRISPRVRNIPHMPSFICCLSLNLSLTIALLHISDIWRTHWNLGFHSSFIVYKSSIERKTEIPLYACCTCKKKKKRIGTEEIKK